MTVLVRRALASLTLLLRRLRASWALSFAVVIGSAALIGVWVGIPLYAESASSRLLSVEVDDAANDGVPFGYLISYNRLSGGNQSWSTFAPLTELIDGENTPFGSTVRARQRLTTSVQFDLNGTVASDGQTSLIDELPFTSLTGFDQLATLTKGRHASPAVSPGEPIEVVVDEDFATANAMSVGELLTVVNQRASLDDPNRSLQVEISGIWRPPETADPFRPSPDPTLRYLTNGSLTGSLVVPEPTLRDLVDGLGDAMLTNAQWLVLLESSSVTTDSVNDLLANTNRISRQVDDTLRGARVIVSPETSLEGFQQDVADLNRGLALFSLPTLALVLAVVGLVVSLRWQRRQREVALLRRRGVPAIQIVTETIGEAALLAGLGAVVGYGAARLVARFMGRTTTFLQFGDGVDLTLVMNSRSWRALVVSALVAAVLIVLPSLGAFRDDVLHVEASSDREATKAWWQRSRLDQAAIVAIAFFSWFLLRRDALQGDLLEDPIVILLPAITAFAVGLLALRALPWLAEQLARLLERTNSTAALLVARRTSRVSRPLAAPLLLLVMTAALAIYTGSLARTLDLQLLDTAHHIVGADNSVRSTADSQLGDRFELDGDQFVRLDPGGAPVDPASFDKIWGVSSASRFSTLPARLTPVSGSTQPVMFTGIDTETFADVAFWRDDYASRPLADLIARLNATPDSLLLAREIMQEAGLVEGDTAVLSVRQNTSVVQVEMVIVGSFDQFPTWVPATQELPPAVGELSDYEARAGVALTSSLLFEADDSDTDLLQTRADFNRLGISASAPRSPEDLIERAQLRPARQGVFGLLTVSFVLSVALTVVGFVFYALFGFTRQLTELGVLRALGLPSAGLSRLVAFDLALLSLTGVGCGAVAGLAMARWYLPALVDSPTGSAPQLIQEIDWQAALGITLLLSAVLTASALALTVVLRRVRLFEAIKVGADS